MKLGIAVYAEAAATAGVLSFLQADRLLPDAMAVCGESASVCLAFAEKHKIKIALCPPAKEQRHMPKKEQQHILFEFTDTLTRNVPPLRRKAAGKRLTKGQQSAKTPPLHRVMERLFSMESMLKRAGCTNVLWIFSHSPQTGPLPPLFNRRIPLPLTKGSRAGKAKAAFAHMAATRDLWLPSLLYLEEGKIEPIIFNS